MGQYSPMCPLSSLAGATAMLSLAVASQAYGADGVTPVATFYVDQRSPHGGNGQSWQTAFTDLQDALTTASRLPLSGQSWRQRLIEIRVAQGTYKPDGPNGDRNRCFDAGGIPQNSAPVLSLRGSFAGLGASDPDRQDFVSTATVLSGDLNGNDGPGWSNRADNSRTILRTESVYRGYLEIEGLEFTGASNMEPDGSGGNYFAYGSALRVSIVDTLGTSPGEFQIRRCSFRDNQTQASDGAGMFLWVGNYAVEDCTFERNRTLTGRGGAVWAHSNYYAGANGRIEHSRFASNSAKHGGALFLQSPAWIFAGEFWDNSASGFGGAVYSATETGLNSVLMVKNSAGIAGGAVMSATSDLLAVSMTTFASNSAPQGAAIDSAFGPIGMYASIAWDSRFDAGSGAIDLGYGVLESWIIGAIVQENAIAFEPGTLLGEDTVIDADPLFIHPASGERNDPAIWNYRLKPGSPAAAMAKNMNGFLQDLDGVNFGCSTLGEPQQFDAGCYFIDSCVCWANLTADWDGLVNDEDFLLFVDAYNITISPPALPRADLNRDGLVDDSDFAVFVQAYDALLCD